MESCLLCLEINKEILDSIRANTTQWKELDIEHIIAKHFWSLNTTEAGSWICLPCWREVEGFHKFYLRIEEAHNNFGKVKMENRKVDNENTELCSIEQEIQIDQKNRLNLAETEIITEHSALHEPVVDKNTAINRNLNELDYDDMLIKMPCKRLRLRNDLESKDPLGKPKKRRKRKFSKAKTATETKYTIEEEDNAREDPRVNDEPEDNVENGDNELKSILVDCIDTSNINDKSAKDSAESFQSKRRSKHHPNRKENEKFIAEHFKQMFCDLCKVPLEDFADMQNHFSETHKQRGYFVCCKKKFSDRTRLIDHIHCHLNPDHFKCKECSKTMSDRIKFDSHMLRVHRANEVVKQHSCDVCGKSFREAYVLRTHKLTHLPEEEKKFHCTDCGKNYGSSYLLNQHRQVVHLKRFVKVCYICGKEINSSAEFKAHMNKHEGIPPPVIYCDVCGLRLTSKRGLKVHKEYQHPVGGKQEHPCPLCDKVSPTSRALKKHVNTMHEKGFDHKCNMCEKAFRRAETLKEHMASHTGTPLYTCPWCSMTFNSNGNMHAHRKNKHPKEYLELKLQNYNFPPIS